MGKLRASAAMFNATEALGLGTVLLLGRLPTVARLQQGFGSPPTQTCVGVRLEVVPRITDKDLAIDALRRLLPRMRFDRRRCEDLLTTETCLAATIRGAPWPAGQVRKLCVLYVTD
jgi:hypothetical protein